MDTKKHIFLSYSRKDSKFALKLVSDLKKNEFNIWVDQIDIPSGEPWDDNIEQALDTAYALLLIISPDSASSSRVKDEVSYALEKEISIIPILYKEASISYRWKRLQFTELNEKNYNQEIDNFTQKLKDINTYDIQLEKNSSTHSTSETPLITKTKSPNKTTYKLLYTIAVLLILGLGIFIYLENKNKASKSSFVASEDVKKPQQIELNVTTKVIKSEINATTIEVADKNTKRLNQQHALKSEKLPKNDFATTPAANKPETALIEKKTKVHNSQTSASTLKQPIQTANENLNKVNIHAPKKEYPKQKVKEESIAPMPQESQTPKKIINCSGSYQEQCEHLKQDDEIQLVINIHTKQVDIVGNEQEKARDIVTHLKRKGFHRSRFVVVTHKDGADKILFSYRN